MRYTVKKNCNVLHNGKTFAGGKEFPAEAAKGHLLGFLDEVKDEKDTPSGEDDTSTLTVEEQIVELMKSKRDVLVDTLTELGGDAYEKDKKELASEIIEIRSK